MTIDFVEREVRVRERLDPRSAAFDPDCLNERFERPGHKALVVPQARAVAVDSLRAGLVALGIKKRKERVGVKPWRRVPRCTARTSTGFVLSSLAFSDGQCGWIRMR